MNDEQRTRGNALRKEIDDIKRFVELAKKRVTVHGVYEGGQTTSLYLKGDVLDIIQTITVAHLEKKLADLVAEYEAL